MAFWNLLVQHHQRNKQRLARFHVFQAAMAASALVAAADGAPDIKEKQKVRDLVRKLDGLELYNPEHGIEVYFQTLADLEKDPGKARAKAEELIASVAGDRMDATMVVTIYQAIGFADGRLDERESAAINNICQILGLSPDALLSETDLPQVSNPYD